MGKIMTLSDAIKHAKDVAESQYGDYRVCGLSSDQCNGLTDCKVMKYGMGQGCIKCAQEHEQLAEWLTELQKRRKHDEEIRKQDNVCVLIKQDDAVAVIVNAINHDDITEEMRTYLFNVLRKRMWSVYPACLLVDGEVKDV